MEDFGKEAVIAVPVASAIQRNDKEVAPLQGCEAHLALLLAGDGIAQLSIQPVENGGLEQEVADAFVLTLQDFFYEIVRDVPVIPGERTDEGVNVLISLHG